MLTRAYEATDPVYLQGTYTGSDVIQIADAPYTARQLPGARLDRLLERGAVAPFGTVLSRGPDGFLLRSDVEPFRAAGAPLPLLRPRARGLRRGAAVLEPHRHGEGVASSTLPIVGGVFVFGVGNIFFPISYIFGDVLTEVYGYARARRVIWAGFMAMIFASVMAWVVVNLPASPTEPFNATLQPAIEVVFGNTWRIAVASIAAFWVGDFVNAYVLARHQGADARPLALDAHDRLDARGAGRRQRDLLSARVRRHLGRPRRCSPSSRSTGSSRSWSRSS